MRVLLINSRAKAFTVPGGDTIQMQKTHLALEQLGVEVFTREVSDLSDLPACDLAHVFNMQEPDTALLAFEKLSKQGIPTVLSPIYWDMYEYWFAEAVQSRPVWRALARIFGKRLLRRAYINWQQSKAPSELIWQQQRSLLDQARRVLPNSKSEGVLLQQSFKFGADFLNRVDVVPNAIDTSLYESIPAASQEFKATYQVENFVLQVGTIYPVKNQLGLLQAIDDLPVPIVYIGQVMKEFNQYAEELKSHAARRGNVIFISQLPYHQLPGIYALAAAHALPSWRETPGLVSLEAGAAGCRVVTTSIGSTEDYFGRLAHYCYPGDPESIRKSVQSALAEPRTPDLRQHILSNFTWQHAAQATLKSYHIALNS